MVTRLRRSTLALTMVFITFALSLTVARSGFCFGWSCDEESFTNCGSIAFPATLSDFSSPGFAANCLSSLERGGGVLVLLLLAGVASIVVGALSWTRSGDSTDSDRPRRFVQRNALVLTVLCLVVATTAVLSPASYEICVGSECARTDCGSIASPVPLHEHSDVENAANCVGIHRDQGRMLLFALILAGVAWMVVIARSWTMPGDSRRTDHVATEALCTKGGTASAP